VTALELPAFDQSIELTGTIASQAYLPSIPMDRKTEPLVFFHMVDNEMPLALAEYFQQT
jgi:hypothetical protein